MRHEPFEPMEYANGDLANELNELFINIKVWLFDEAAKLRDRHPKPTAGEIDSIHMSVHRVLMKDARPMRRR
jgi:hypothetical protein